MSQAALIRELEAMLSGDYNPIAAIVEAEEKRGFRVIRPGDAPWFRAMDWVPASVASIPSVASIHGASVRLVLLHAVQSGKGAFTRTIEGIVDSGFKPLVIDPTPEFAAALKRRGWHGKQTGNSFETRETVWRMK